MEKREKNVGLISNIKIKSNNEKQINLIDQRNQRNSTPPSRITSKSERKQGTSGSKKRISDRFIPSAIGKNLINEFQSKSKSLINKKENIQATSISKAQSLKKGEINYQKILQSEILEESTPKFEEKSGTVTSKGMLDLFKINRQLKYHSEVKRIRKLKINKENSNESKSYLPINEEKRVIYDVPYKSYHFENVSDNFYLNNLDMWDITRVAIGTKNGVHIFDGTKDPSEENFNTFTYDSSSEILSLKFLNSNRIIFSDGNYNLKIKDFNKEIEIIKFDSIQRKFITMDFDRKDENIIYLGSDNSCVDMIDLRATDKIYHLYKHESKNEVCKVKFSSKNRFLISGGNDNRVIIFDKAKNEIVNHFKHKAAVKGLAYNESESLLASGGGTFDKTIKIWDLKKFSQISENTTDSQITNLEFFPNDILAVSNGYISNNIVLYNLEIEKKHDDGLLLNSLISDKAPVHNLLKKISVFEKHTKRILYMSKSSCNNYLSSLSTDGNLRLWKLSRYIQRITCPIESVFCAIR
jgi:WD40 repeat protein